MRKSTRLGIIVLTLGLSLVVVAVVRGGNTSEGSTFFQINPHAWGISSYSWVPRDLIIRIEAPVSVNFKLFDPSMATILNVENATGSYKLHLKDRGEYTLSIYNPSNSTINVQAHTTLYNLEADIIQTSTILIISGATIIVAQRLYSTFRHNGFQRTKRA